MEMKVTFSLPVRRVVTATCERAHAYTGSIKPFWCTWLLLPSRVFTTFCLSVCFSSALAEYTFDYVCLSLSKAKDVFTAKFVARSLFAVAWDSSDTSEKKTLIIPNKIPEKGRQDLIQLEISLGASYSAHWLDPASWCLIMAWFNNLQYSGLGI